MISFIGDVHGSVNRYHLIQRKCSRSVQLGDFGFAEAWGWLHPDVVDPGKHKVLGGNHDCYPVAQRTEHYLGDYGLTGLGATEFFFVRGAESDDKDQRVRGHSWWEEEELTATQFAEAMKLYAEKRPDVVVSHDCPASVLSEFATNAQRRDRTSRTRAALESMLEIHRPRFWVFGHHHRTKTLVQQGTHFQCVGELERWDLP